MRLLRHIHVQDKPIDLSTVKYFPFQNTLHNVSSCVSLRKTMRHYPHGRGSDRGRGSDWSCDIISYN